MRKSVALLLLALLGSALVIPACAEFDADVIDDDDEYEDPGADFEERAVLIAHKSVLEDHVVQGRNMTVVISIHNVGQSPASSVRVTDTLPSAAKFKLIEGGLEADLGTIDVGSKAELRYTAIPAGNGAQLADAATVSYTALPDDEMQTTLLSSSPYVFVLSKGQNIQLMFIKMGKYVSLGMLKTPGDWIGSGLVIGTLMLVVGVYTGCTSVSQQRADHRRKQFTKELGIGSE